MWLLSPIWAERFAQGMKDEASDWDVTRVRIALVDKGQAELRLELLDN